tara:strand:- start:5818 stop:6759 length:942 start_codon:yes stop_codon:yes gene_type:complete
MTLKNLFMNNKNETKKYVFLGDTNSINIEIIAKSHSYLKKKIQYLLIGNISELENYLKKIKCTIQVNEILDPIKFVNYNKNLINIFNVEKLHKEKYKNLLHQLTISNDLSNKTKFDLITMPIDKSIFKKNIKFIGVTEYLGTLNNCKTMMLMRGEKFSVIPLTTHINLKDVYKNINYKETKESLNRLCTLIKSKKYKLDFKVLKFLCYNPHCGENGTLGKQDKYISQILYKNFQSILGPLPADSAFKNYDKNTLFISTYHDQALIPFKILNKKGFNLTLGLNYLRLSPAHGTALNIKYKNQSNNESYLACMLS